MPPVTPEPTEPELIAVAPNAPTAAARCAQEPEIAIPTQEGVNYAQSQVGSILTVAASAQPGYVLATGAPSSWTFDLTPTPVAVMPVTLPDRIEFSPQFDQGSPDELHLLVQDSAIFAAIAAAEDQGLTSALTVADRVVVAFVAYDPDTGLPTADTESFAWSATLAYDAAATELVVTIADVEALQASFETARAAVQARHPGAEVVQSGFPDLGLALETSFVQGPGCGPALGTVPIVLGLPS